MKFLEGIPEPTWPMADGFGNDRLVERAIKPWKEIEAQGPAVFVGEWGAYKHTPHGVTMAWMEDCLRNWKNAGWGWCLWNFEGDFGPLNSGRTDVDYEDYKGFKLDRKMLELLRRY
jgi:endoglucanase